MNRLATTRTMEAQQPAYACARIVVHGQLALCDPLGALFLPDHGLLVVSDLHLEKGAAFARRGQLLPPYDTLSTLTVLNTVIARHDPKIVVSLGDNFHDRAGSVLLPDAYRAMIADMARGRQWIWINGNHDPDGACGLPGESMDALCYAGLTFRHEPGLGVAPGEVAGHLHPAATVRRREKSVRRPCFASDGARLVMPAFGVMTGGLDLGHRAFAGLFDRKALIAHLLGRDRIYSVRPENFFGLEHVARKWAPVSGHRTRQREIFPPHPPAGTFSPLGRRGQESAAFRSSSPQRGEVRRAKRRRGEGEPRALSCTRCLREAVKRSEVQISLCGTRCWRSSR